MANPILSPGQRRRYPPAPPTNEEPFSPIIGDTIFTWLDTCETDFERFRKKFCKQTIVEPQQWLFFDKENTCYQFIERSVTIPKKVILVTSGRLGQSLIENLHHCEQLDSVYIYCQDVDKYNEFAQYYKKVVGVYSDPVVLFTRLKDNLDKHRADTVSSTDSIFFPEEFSQPNLKWNPWDMNTCTKTLPIKGQATIAVKQTGSIPFELILSNTNDLNAIREENNYSIVLTVNKLEVTLSTYVNDQTHLLDRTDESHHILQTYNDDQQHIYWLNFSKDTATVMYGIGEIRPKFKVLEAYLDNRHLSLMSNIAYLHVKINYIYENFQTIDYLEDKIQFLIGNSRFVEPNLLVVRTSQSSLLNNSLFSSGISPLTLAESCRSLYHSLIQFKLDDEDFPDFIPAIEYSVTHPSGWCHQKIIDKANRFGRPKLEISCIRLTLAPFIIEIWPPGHFSPIHNHKNAYGMFRVLHGSILIRLFPALALNLQYEAPIEYILHQDQVTWMLPTLNQTHQMKNVELNSCCIIVQCYDYESDDNKRNEEYFDYIVNNGRDIQPMKPTSDMKFGAFKEKIQNEWNQRCHM